MFWIKSNFEDALKTIFDTVVKVYLDKIWDITLQEVSKLRASDLVDDDKRKAAFDAIKERVLGESLDAKDHLINLAIELAVAWIKKRTGE